MTVAIAGMGAVLGALVRYAITNYGKAHWSKNFPYATLLINLTGAFILGFLFTLKLPIFVYAFLATGILGGYTTFSTLNTELVGKLNDKKYSTFWLYLILSYVGGIVAVYLGFLLGKLI